MEGGTNGLMSAQTSNEEYKIGFNLDSAHALSVRFWTSYLASLSHVYLLRKCHNAGENAQSS